MLFICPVDKTVTLELSEEQLKSVPHCTTLRLNSTCDYIALGCTGCEFKQRPPLFFSGQTLTHLAAKFKSKKSV